MGSIQATEAVKYLLSAWKDCGRSIAMGEIDEVRAVR